jgi:chemotaxis protein histidine kinase CheA
MVRTAFVAGCVLAVCHGSVLSTRAGDITREQIEQLQKSRHDAQATRDSLEKSLRLAEEKARNLATLISKLKTDLAATRSALNGTEKELAAHADAVRKFDEERAQALVKAAAEAKTRRDQAAASVKSAQDKIHAQQDEILRLKGEKAKAAAATTAAEKSVKDQQAAAIKAQSAALAAKADADAALKKAAEATHAAEKALAEAKQTKETLASTRRAEKAADEKIGATEKSLAADEHDIAKSRQALAELSAQAILRQKAAEKSLIALGKLESFAEKVAPILSKRCLACHDAKTAKGRFSLETFASLMRGGESGLEIVPGKSGQSNLVTLIEDGTMPQDADPLTKAEIAAIRRWIDTGAALDAGLNPTDPLIADMPSLPQPLPPANYRVPIPVTAVAFSPDGEQLATSGYHEILVWNTADGTPLRRITNVAERVYSLQYSPDGKLIAVGAGTPAQLGEVKLFSAATGDLVADLARTSDAIFCVAFSPDGKRLAAGGADRSIRVYDVATGKQQLAIDDHADWVMDLAWLPDGSKLVSASRDKTAKVFDARTGDSLVTFNGHAEPVFGVAIAPDGVTAITSGRDKSLRRWNVADGKEVQRITGFGDDVLHVAVSKDGRIYSASADRTARVHSPSGGLLKTLSGHADWVYSLAFCQATERLATGSFDGEVRLWHVADGKALVKFLAAPGYKKQQVKVAARSSKAGKSATQPAVARAAAKK